MGTSWRNRKVEDVVKNPPPERRDYRRLPKLRAPRGDEIIFGIMVVLGLVVVIVFALVISS